jgi:hypothetical protein
MQCTDSHTQAKLNELHAFAVSFAAHHLMPLQMAIQVAGHREPEKIVNRKHNNVLHHHRRPGSSLCLSPPDHY